MAKIYIYNSPSVPKSCSDYGSGVAKSRDFFFGFSRSITFVLPKGITSNFMGGLIGVGRDPEKNWTNFFIFYTLQIHFLESKKIRI